MSKMSDQRSEQGGVDWPALMRAGIRGLGLRPAEFWALTPAELLMMLGTDRGAAAMGRVRLDELARAYPRYAAILPKDGRAKQWMISTRWTGSRIVWPTWKV